MSPLLESSHPTHAFQNQLEHHSALLDRELAQMAQPHPVKLVRLVTSKAAYKKDPAGARFEYSDIRQMAIDTHYAQRPAALVG